MADDKTIPPEELEKFARAHDQRQAIFVGWGNDGLTYVVTWGDSIVDSLQASRGGNVVKQALGFPEALCRDCSPRVRRALAFYAQAGMPWEPPGNDTPRVVLHGCCPFTRSGGLHGESCAELGHGPCTWRQGAAAGPGEGEAQAPPLGKSQPVDARAQTLSQALLLEAEAAGPGNADDEHG